MNFNFVFLFFPNYFEKSVYIHACLFHIFTKR